MSLSADQSFLRSLVRPALVLGGVSSLFLLVFVLPRIPENRAFRRRNALHALATKLSREIEETKTKSAAYPRPLPFTAHLDSPPPFIAEFGTLANPEAIDTFLPRKRIPLVYQTDGPRWVLISMGPDEVYSLPPRQFLANKLSATALANVTYDPTNGMFSPGDFYQSGPGPKP